LQQSGRYPAQQKQDVEGRAAGISKGAVSMAQVKTLVGWMAERGIGLAGLVEASGLDGRVVEAVARGRYTPSPQQRQRLSAALGVVPGQVAWGHRAQVEHVYGRGPQFGRSP
jgi:hypothetical protein